MRRELNYGFPIHSGYEFRVGGLRHRIRSNEQATLRLLGQLYLEYHRAGRVRGILAYRHRIRRLRLTVGSASILCHVVGHTNDSILRLLAIWLRGHCGGHFGTSAIARFWDDPDELIRKEVARTLKRMHAWSQLNKIAKLDSNERIRRIATASSSQPFESRLERFAAICAADRAEPRSRALVASAKLVLGQGRPPKSDWLIRMYLERIHQLVMGRYR